MNARCYGLKFNTFFHVRFMFWFVTNITTVNVIKFIIFISIYRYSDNLRCQTYFIRTV